MSAWYRTPDGRLPQNHQPASLGEDVTVVLIALGLSVLSIAGWSVIAWVIWLCTGWSLFS
jgi:hypothetical protein